MTEAHVCLDCGLDLPNDAPEGLCPQCLLRSGVENGWAQPDQNGQRHSTGQFGGFFIPPEPAELAPHFPQLEFLAILGQGGMGAVYKARQTKLDRLVAVKILPPGWGRDPAFAERFSREARALARLSHPNIVAVHDFGESGGQFYFIMEYVDGASLRQLLQSGRLQPQESIKIVGQVCEALQYAHEECVVHRDIKPENILLDKKGRVKIADFGLAKMLLGRAPIGFTLTGSHQVMGTPHYMAPEQMEKPQTVDHRADIYSLGVVFYEMLTGELPLGRFAPPSHKAPVDVRLDEVVMRALAKEPEHRYQRASELKGEVDGSGKAAPAPVHARSSGVVMTLPFRNPHHFGGLNEARGLMRLEGNQLVLEYEIHYLGMFKLGLTEKRIFLADLQPLSLNKGWWSTELVLRAARLSAFSGIATNRFGQVDLSIDSKDREFAERFVAAANARIPAAGQSPAERYGDLAGAAPSIRDEDVFIQLAAPAVALTVTSFLAVLFWIIVGIVCMGVNEPHFRDFGGPVGFMFIASIAGIIVVLLAGLMFMGARKMRRVESFEMCMLAIFLAMLPWSAHFIIGFPVGLWAFIVMRRQDVRQAFAARMRGDSPTPPPMPTPLPILPPTSAELPAQTGPVRRKMRSIVRAFRTLIFNTSPPTAASATDCGQALAIKVDLNEGQPVAEKCVPRVVVIPVPRPKRKRRRWFLWLVFLALSVVAVITIVGSIAVHSIRSSGHPATAVETVRPTFPATDPIQDTKALFGRYGIQAAQNNRRVSDIIAANYQEYIKEESKFSSFRLNENGRLVVTIQPFPMELTRLEDRLYSELDAVLGRHEQFQVRAITNLPNILFPNGRGQVTIELWKVGTWYHWNISRNDGGLTGGGSTPELPKRLREFWEHRKDATPATDGLKTAPALKDKMLKDKR